MAFGEGGGDATAPLISSDGPKRHLNIARNGNEWTASAHVITAVIGSGVLSLAWSMAQLGWVAGPGMLVVFASVTALQSTIFADCYRSPDPEHGPHRNRTYAHAVERNLGSSSAWVCQLLQQTALFGYGIAYTITASISFRAARILAQGEPLRGAGAMAVQHSLQVIDGRCDDDGSPPRTGTEWTCAAHIITAVIGSGVLSLAWGVAQLGWVAGPVCMLCFAVVTYVSASLLSDCYRCQDAEKGPRNRSYMDAVRVYLGKRQTWACGSLQYLSLYGCGVAYTITTATSIRAILKANCYHAHGHDAPCSFDGSYYMLMFGGAQLLLSSIPDFHDMAWLSVLAAVMSFSYAFIGLGLGLASTISNGVIKGSITGVPMKTPLAKVWRVSQAIGDIAFAYPYSLILLEIQDTLKSPPAENKTMKKASIISILVTTFFYLCCGCFGYAAFGSDAPGNLLTGFGFYEPYWLIDFANACIILHLLGGYQVYSQPIYQFADRYFAERYPGSGFVNDFHTVKVPLLPPYRVNLLRVCFRTVYVASTTAVALFFPYFNEILALLGALNFWPLAIYFPVEMYFIQRKVPRWSTRWLVLQGFSTVCLLVSAFALVGSIQGVISQKLG